MLKIDLLKIDTALTKYSIVKNINFQYICFRNQALISDEVRAIRQTIYANKENVSVVEKFLNEKVRKPKFFKVKVCYLPDDLTVSDLETLDFMISLD